MYCSDGRSGQTIRGRWNDTEEAQVHVREMDHRTRCGGHESAAAFEQDARHHDFQEVQRGKVAVDAARAIDGPGNQKQVDSNLRVRLPDVRFVQLEQTEPAGRERIDDCEQEEHVHRRLFFSSRFHSDEHRKNNQADIDQPQKPFAAIHDSGIGHRAICSTGQPA